jgi:hypothetical protein
MAKPPGLGSGLLALTTFSYQRSVALYETIKGFSSHHKRVSDLLQELEALSNVLGILADLFRSKEDVDLSLLELPLLRCGNACQDFEQEILSSSSRSGDSRTGVRDWAELRYMGEDIDAFREMLSAYKLTISIALTNENM